MSDEIRNEVENQEEEQDTVEKKHGGITIGKVIGFGLLGLAAAAIGIGAMTKRKKSKNDDEFQEDENDPEVPEDFVDGNFREVETEEK